VADVKRLGLVLLVLLAAVPAAPARAQVTPRRVALVYDIWTDPLFAPDGEPHETAGSHVDTLLRRLRSVERARNGARFAIAVQGVVCDELALLETPAARRTLAALKRIARTHRVLRTLYAGTRVDHLSAKELGDQLVRGDGALEACLGVAPKDPFVPPDLALTSADRVRDLSKHGVRSALSAFAVPPVEPRPTIIAAASVPGARGVDPSAARPEASSFVAVAASPNVLGAYANNENLDIVDVSSVGEDVVGGVIDPSFDLPRSYERALSRAGTEIDYFRSYTLEDNPLTPIYETVLARAASTGAWGEFGLDQATERASDLAGVLERARGQISVTPGSVTFTSRSGVVPVTIANRANYPIRIEVGLESTKLDFVTPKDVVVVEPPGDTVTFQAIARSTGSFPIEVTVRSPGGRVTFDRAEITVRSTAANFSALILTAGGALFLVYWLIMRARRKKSAR
jgi:hypothetical protein